VFDQCPSVSASQPKAAPKPKKLIHTPDVFVQFDLIDLTPPLDYSSIEAAITAVQEKVSHTDSPHIFHSL
jgi:hypothetical protein